MDISVTSLPSGIPGLHRDLLMPRPFLFFLLQPSKLRRQCTAINSAAPSTANQLNLLPADALPRKGKPLQPLIPFIHPLLSPLNPKPHHQKQISMSLSTARMASLFRRLSLFLLLLLPAAFLLSEASDLLIDSPLLSSKVDSKIMLKVDPEGKGNFTSVQDAVDAVPEGNSQWIIIHLKRGVYREKVTIPESKPFIFLRGNGKGKTTIIWNGSAAKEADSSSSATFTVLASNFIAWGVSFKNDAPSGAAGSPFNQSVAVVVGGDKSAFYHCGFYSAHNTLFDYKGRHFYESCYIQGSIDFIYGQAQSLFKSCEIFVVADKRSEILGSITAQNRQYPEQNGGFVFLKGKVYGIGKIYLGRARGENLLYAEHECHGPGAVIDERVPWSKQLTSKEAEPYLGIDWIGGKDWLPVY
ncbi:putative pectinesterase 67 [Nymphaea thermarum]|nr:putative pectinesterase 67 [Nymphaea thermarum]